MNEDVRMRMLQEQREAFERLMRAQTPLYASPKEWAWIAVATGALFFALKWFLEMN